MIESEHISITKEEIATLPVVEFSGRKIVIDTIGECDKAVAYLSTFQKLGFDTETKPAFKKGVSHKVALLQLSTQDSCFLFRLNRIGMPDSLADLLMRNDILKIGLSLKDDNAQIFKLAGFIPQGSVELQSFVKHHNIKDNSLQKIFAIIFKQKISKRQRLTNWEADTLTDSQQGYAAIDAWACLMIYNKLNNGE
ncbi:MAG: 3'-5' exonuclease [Bacteroidales bacterium]